MADPRQYCTAHTRSGKPCRNPPINGATVCRMHGGSAPQVRKAAEARQQREQAAEAVATYGLPREVDPHAALLEELHRTAGHVAWLTEIIAELDTEGGRGTLVEATMFGEQPSIWLKLHAQERKHFTDVARACIAAGIEERRVRLAEEQGQMLAQVIRGILTDLGVADRKEVPAVVRKHLTLVAG